MNIKLKIKNLFDILEHTSIFVAFTGMAMVYTAFVLKLPVSLPNITTAPYKGLKN